MMKNKQRCLFLVLFGLQIYNLPTSLLAADSSSAEYKKVDYYLKQGDHQNAYNFAQTLSKQHIGTISFDLLLGDVALAVNKNDEAILAFDRVLINDPTNAKAKFGIAQAYYNLRMYNKAKIEAQSLLVGKYKPSMVEKTQNILTKIQQKISRQNKSYRFYGNMVAGYNTNVAATSDDDYFNILDLMGIHFKPADQDDWDEYNQLVSKLRRNNRKLASFYLSPKLGVSGKYKTRPESKYSVIWDLNVTHRQYTDVGKYNTDKIYAALGLNHKLNNLYFLEGGFYYTEFFKNGRRHNESPMVYLSLGRKLNKNNTLKISTHDGLIVYPARRARSVNVYTGSLEWIYHNGINSLTTQAFVGRQQPRGGSNTYRGNDNYGLNMFLKHKINPRINLTFGAGYKNFMYDAKQFKKGGKRHDMLWRFFGGFDVKLNSGCTWYVNNVYTNNRSNLFVYTHDRFDVLTGIKFTL